MLLPFLSANILSINLMYIYSVAELFTCRKHLPPATFTHKGTTDMFLHLSISPLLKGKSCPLVKHELPHRFLLTTWFPADELILGFMPEKDKKLRVKSLYLNPHDHLLTAQVWWKHATSYLDSAAVVYKTYSMYVIRVVCWKLFPRKQ